MCKKRTDSDKIQRMGECRFGLELGNQDVGQLVAEVLGFAWLGTDAVGEAQARIAALNLEDCRGCCYMV